MREVFLVSGNQHVQAPPASAAINMNERPAVAAAALAVVGSVALIVAPSAALSAWSMLLLVAAFALQPAFGLALLGLTLPFYLIPKSFGSMSFPMPELLLISTVAGVTVRGVWMRVRGIKISVGRLATPFDLPMVLFLAAALLSLLASEVMRVSLRDLRTLILEPVAAFYLTVWTVRRPEHIKLLLAGLLLGGIAAAVMGLSQYFFTDHVITAEGARRVLGPYSSPNELGLYLGRVIPLTLGFAIFAPGYRPFAWAALLPLTAALILTFSLGAWLATLLAVAGIVLLWRSRAVVYLATAAVALAAASMLAIRSDRIASHFSLTHGTSFIRIQLWESSLQMIRDHPILGVGMDNFLYLYRSRYILPDAVAEPNLSHPHNLVLNFWLQMGILGLAAILWILFELARRWLSLWKSKLAPWERAALAGIAGAMIDMVAHGMVDNSYFLVDLAFFFWLAVGIITVLQGRSIAEGSPSVQANRLSDASPLHESGRIE